MHQYQFLSSQVLYWVLANTEYRYKFAQMKLSLYQWFKILVFKHHYPAYLVVSLLFSKFLSFVKACQLIHLKQVCQSRKTSTTCRILVLKDQD